MKKWSVQNWRVACGEYFVRINTYIHKYVKKYLFSKHGNKSYFIYTISHTYATVDLSEYVNLFSNERHHIEEFPSLLTQPKILLLI